MATRTKPKTKRPRLAVPAACSGLMNKQQVGDALGGFTVRTVTRMIASGEVPPPDTVRRGRSLWKVATINAFVAAMEGGGDGLGVEAGE